MKIEQPKCPMCGELANGILETVPCRALINDLTPGGVTEYAGESEMFWDDQERVQKDGKTTVLCPKGHEWLTVVTFEEVQTP